MVYLKPNLWLVDIYKSHRWFATAVIGWMSKRGLKTRCTNGRRKGADDLYYHLHKAVRPTTNGITCYSRGQRTITASGENIYFLDDLLSSTDQFVRHVFFISAPWFKRAFLWIYICLLGSGLACLSLFRFFWLCLVVLAHVFVDNKFQQHWFSVQLKVAPNHPNVSRHADVTSLSSQLEEVDKEEELLKNILKKKT